MDEVVVKWSGPYKLTEPTPYAEGGETGLYIVVQDHDDVVYVGMANTNKGAMARARSHKEKYTRRRNMRGLHYNESRVKVYVGHISPAYYELVGLAEHLLISHLYRTRWHQMVNSQKLYYEWKQPLRILNEAETTGKMSGMVPSFLPKVIESPSEPSY